MLDNPRLDPESSFEGFSLDIGWAKFERDICDFVRLHNFFIEQYIISKGKFKEQMSFNSAIFIQGYLLDNIFNDDEGVFLPVIHYYRRYKDKGQSPTPEIIQKLKSAKERLIIRLNNKIDIYSQELSAPEEIIELLRNFLIEVQVSDWSDLTSAYKCSNNWVEMEAEIKNLIDEEYYNGVRDYANEYRQEVLDAYKQFNNPRRKPLI